jgi:hypothetical protein
MNMTSIETYRLQKFGKEPQSDAYTDPEYFRKI